MDGGIVLIAFGPVINVVLTHGKGDKPCLGQSFEIIDRPLSRPVIHMTHRSPLYIRWLDLKLESTLYLINARTYEGKGPSFYDLEIRALLSTRSY